MPSLPTFVMGVCVMVVREAPARQVVEACECVWQDPGEVVVAYGAVKISSRSNKRMRIWRG